MLEIRSCGPKAWDPGHKIGDIVRVAGDPKGEVRTVTHVWTRTMTNADATDDWPFDPETYIHHVGVSEGKVPER